MKKNTKIICTLGPASEGVETLEKMMVAGMNVARLNFSHGSYDHMKKLIRNVQKAAKKCGKTITLLQDLQGPKIRLGKLPNEGVRIKQGEKVILSTETKEFNEKPLTLPVQYKNLHKDVKKKDRILIDDGYLEVEVNRKERGKLYCTVKHGGLFKSNKGLNCPTATISAKTITSKDLKDLTFGLKQGIDWVALSFVKSAQDIKDLRKILEKKGYPNIKIIAKIERHEAVEEIEEIATTADGLMVARGDMGLEIAAEKVPIVQKEILRLGVMHAKPVIIATQILESMIENPRATRAEISDAANAIFDHADALMLSAETSIGKHPIRAVRTLSKVAYVTEKELQKRGHLLPNHLYMHDLPITDATCFNAALLADNINASAIVVITKTGYTAQQVLKHRPTIPVIAVTYGKKTEQQLQLVWGVNKIFIQKKKISSEKRADELISKLLLKEKIAKKGEQIVIVNAGSTNNFISTVIL
jgi:pyruvate kinase